MFNRAIVIAVAALMIIVQSSSTFASQLAEKQKELQNINAKIEATRNKQEDAAKRQAEINQQIQQSTEKMIQIQRKINTTQAELNKVIAEKQAAEAKLGETQKHLEETQVKLDETRKRLDLRRYIFNKRLASSYKNRKINIVILLLNSKNLVDFINRFTLLSMVAQQDGRIVFDLKRLTADIANEVSQIETTKEAIEQQRAELAAAKERIDALFQTIVSQKKQLENEIARQRELYDQIQEERRKLAQTESELRISSRIVAGQIIALQTGGTTRAIGPTPELKALAISIAQKYGIPPNLFIALIWQESGWNYRAVSRVGATGLTQIMPFNIVAWGYNIETFRNSPSQQLEAGAWYLSQQYKTFGRWDLALAAYNAGPGAVKDFRDGTNKTGKNPNHLITGGIPPWRVTQNYVKNILAMAGM